MSDNHQTPEMPETPETNEFDPRVTQLATAVTFAGLSQKNLLDALKFFSLATDETNDVNGIRTSLVAAIKDAKDASSRIAKLLSFAISAKN